MERSQGSTLVSEVVFFTMNKKYCERVWGEVVIYLDMDLNLGNDADGDNSTKGKDEDRAPTSLGIV